VVEQRAIVDTGPLVAFLVKEETHHQWAAQQFQQLQAPLLTAEAVLTEAFFLLTRVSHGTTKFFELLDSGLLHVDFSIIGERIALEKLVRRYANVPMSLADACLVRLSELYAQAVVFSLDHHFQIYRRHGRQPIPLLIPPRA
jgi:predicted nucleic acid-binding protein